MEMLVFLIPLSLVLGLLGLAGFLWALRSGQFSDLEGDAARILLDDTPLSDREGPPGRGGPGRAGGELAGGELAGGREPAEDGADPRSASG